MEFHAQVIWTDRPEQYVVNLPNVGELFDVTIRQFGIDDARDLKKNAYQTALESKQGRVFVVRTEAVTIEAQQALLKLLEEPPTGVKILFILRTGVALLSTVLSRCQVTDAVVTTVSLVFQEFLELSYKDRLAMIDERQRTKDSEWFTAFQAGLGEWLRGVGSSIPPATRSRVQAAYRLLSTRGASNKLLSEHIALCLPVA